MLGSFEKLVPYCTKGIKLSPAPVADLGFANGGPRSSAVGTRGARIEAPKAPRKVWCSEGVPLPTGEGSGEGQCPLAIFFDFGSRNVDF